MDDDRTLYLRWLTTRDETAFLSLARRHASLVVDVGWRFSQDWARAEDALQEALLLLARDGTERPAEVGVRAWLAREALSRARHALASDRARARRERAVGASRGEEAMPKSDDSTVAHEVRAALDRLEGDERVALTLRYLHQVEYAEIAAILGVAEPTARVRVHRALERLRGESRRSDLDEKGLAGVLLVVPRAAVPAQRLESAIAAAIAGARGTGPAVTGTTAAAGTAAWLRWGITVVVLAAVGVAYLAMRPAENDGVTRDVASAPQSSEPANTPGLLAGRQPSVPRAGNSTAPPGNEVVPAPAPATPAPRPSHPGRGATALVRLRMDLVKADGSTQEIAISEIYSMGVGTRVDADHPAEIEARPGHGVTVRTEDARAAFPVLFARVPDPAPGALILRMPSADHPRLASLVLEVVDAGTGAPIPSARIEWEPDSPVQSPSTSDAAGRAVLVVPDSKVERAALFAGLAGELVCVHADGYRMYGAWRAFDGSRKELAPAVDATAAESWLETGAYRIRMHREVESGSTPTPKEWVSVERSVRFVDGSDRPLVGAYVAVLRHLPPKAMENVRLLGAAVTASDITQGFRRTDADGVIRAPMASLMALELRIDGVPFAAWGVAAEGWPESGPRIIRVPDACDLDVAVVGLPAGAAASWGLDTLGAARSLGDGPCEGRHVTYDAAVARDVSAGGMSPAWLCDTRGGALDAADSTIHLRLAVGNPCRVLVTVRGAPSPSDEGTRVLEVRPDRAGAVRLVRRWDELPALETELHGEGAAPRPPGTPMPGK